MTLYSGERIYGGERFERMYSGECVEGMYGGEHLEGIYGGYLERMYGCECLIIK